MANQLLFTQFLNAHFAGIAGRLMAMFHIQPANASAPISDTLSMELLVVAVLLIFFLIVRLTLSVEKPNPVQHLAEAVDGFVSQQGEAIIGHGHEKFTSFLTVLFLFILLCNLVGLIPSLESPTANIVVPLGCAIVTFAYYQFHGLRVHGFAYVKYFLGPVDVSVWMWLLAPLMLLIETFSHLARLLSLSVRLYANIFAGDMVTLAFFSLIPVGIPLVFLVLHLGVSILQAFIFMALAMSYLSLAVAEEH
jgi:F-type H+-transporting ATPase subunit a